MDLSSNSPDPEYYHRIDASMLPTVPMLPSHLFITSQTTSPIPPNVSNLPTYQTNTLPPLSLSPHTSFVSPCPSVPHPNPQSTRWLQMPVPPLANEVSGKPSCTTANAGPATYFTHVPANITIPQHDTPQPVLIPPTQTSTCASESIILAPPLTLSTSLPSNTLRSTSLPGGTATISTPPFQYVTAPVPTASLPPVAPSGATPGPVAQEQATSEPVKKTHARQRKRTSSVKRSRPQKTTINRSQTESVENCIGLTSSRPATHTASGHGYTPGRPKSAGMQNEAKPPASKEAHDCPAAPSRRSVSHSSIRDVSQSGSVPSRSSPVGNKMTFVAPDPRQASQGLNFADVMLADKAYCVQGARHRYGLWRIGLEARARAGAGNDGAAADGGMQSQNNKSAPPTSVEAVTPKTTPGALLASKNRKGSKQGQASRARGAKSRSKPRPPRPRCRGPAVSRRCVPEPLLGATSRIPVPSSSKPRNNEHLKPAIDALQLPLVKDRATQELRGGDIGTCNESHRLNSSPAPDGSSKSFCRRKDKTSMTDLTTVTNGGSSNGRSCGEDEREEAAEHLMRIATTAQSREITGTTSERNGGVIPHARTTMKFQQQRNNVGSNCRVLNDKGAITEERIDMRQTLMDSNGEAATNNSSLKNATHLKGMKYHKNRTAIQIENNYRNFADERHSMSSVQQLAQPNPSHEIEKRPIPGPSSSTVPDIPQPSVCRSTPTAMPSSTLTAKSTESTPTDVRNTRDLFTGYERPSLHSGSRNHSLAQETGLFEECITTPEQLQHYAIPQPSRTGSATVLLCKHPRPPSACAAPQQHPADVVRPLFKERRRDASLINPPSPHVTLTTTQHPTDHLRDSRAHQNSTPLVPRVQNLYPLHVSKNQSTSKHQQPSTGVMLMYPALPHRSVIGPDKTESQAEMPQCKKRTTQKRPPHDKFAPSRPVTSSKIAKPKRPRPPKTSPAASPFVTGAALTNTINSVPIFNVARLATGSPQSTSGNNQPTETSLRLRANFTTTPCVAEKEHSPVAARDQHSMQQPFVLTQTGEGAACNTFPRWQHQSAPPQSTIGNLSLSSAQPKGKDVPAAKCTSPNVQMTYKTPAKANKAAFGRAFEAAEKAAQSIRNVPNISQVASVNPHQPEQPLPINLQTPLPPRPIRTLAAPHDGQQLHYAKSAQQNTSERNLDPQACPIGNATAQSASAKDPVAARSLSRDEVPLRNNLADHLHVSTGPALENHDASSPRTESTQQTLPQDTFSGTPSDDDNSSESDDIPLAQAKRYLHPVSRPSASAPQSTPKATFPLTQQRRIDQNLLTQQPSTSLRGKKADPQSKSAASPGSQDPVSYNLQPSSRKRQIPLKTAEGNKRKKRNSTCTVKPKQSTGKKKSQNGLEAECMHEDSTQVAAVQSRKRVGSEPRKITPKKSSTRGQPKSKAVRHPTPSLKRSPPNVKTQIREKSKRSTAQSKCTTAIPTCNGQNKLRLCLSVKEKEARDVPESGAGPPRDSCGSPVTPDRATNDDRDSSKVSPKTGSRAQKVNMDRKHDIEKGQASPSFAAELTNLRSSGILKTTKEIFTPPSSGDRDPGVPTMQRIVCVLCQKDWPRGEMAKHPCFPVRAFDVCKTCANIISKRVEAHGAKRRKGSETNERDITQRTTLFVMLIEEVVRHFSPSGREHRDIERIYEFINNRNWQEMVQRAESLSLPLDILTVLRVTLRKIGFTIRAGKLRWPIGDFTLPTIADTCAMVSHAVPARIDDLRKGILPGEAAWNETFGENYKLGLQSSSCAIYKQVLGLIGLKLEHATECNAGDSAGTCKVRFEAVGVGALMYRAAAMLSGTATRDLLAACWTKGEAFRYIDEAGVELVNESFEGAFKSCCICGGSEKPQQESCPFRFTNCTECLKLFCSVCLLNVLGTSEYLRSFGEGGYCCMICRLQKNAELCPQGKANGGYQDRKLRLHNLGGIRKKGEKRMKPMPPLLLLSPSVKADVLLRLESADTREARGVAKFCEIANDNNVRHAMDSQYSPASHDICLSCKLPADSEEQESKEREVLRCGYEMCVNVMHRNCLPPQRQARRRGFRSKWSCPHHQCAKCEQRDETKLLRCRTCPITYCKEHMPLPSQVYLFSEKLFACSSCRSFLRVPQMLRLKLQWGKSERKRNHVAQALAIGQRKRSAVVRKLSEHPRCSDTSMSFLIESR